MNPVTETNTAPPVRAQPVQTRVLLWCAGALACLFLAAAFALPFHRSGADGFHYFGTPVFQQAPDFTLTDQEGKPFQLSSLRGKLVLMTFGFTHCPNICPTTMADLALIYRSLTPEEKNRVQVLFISVDPERDTPAALKGYVPYYNPAFIGLTGTPEQIAAAAKAYGVSYETQYQTSKIAANYYTINHSAYTYLINPAGKYALVYDYEKLPASESILSDIRHELRPPGGGN